MSIVREAFFRLGLAGPVSRRDLRKVGLTNSQSKSFLRAFAAEQSATFNGLKAFRQDKLARTDTSPLLRRNIHRLEKGLSHPKLKPVFGEKFIAETVTLYRSLALGEDAHPSERKWAFDVLSRYFDLVDASADPIRSAKADFEKIPHKDTQGSIASAPFSFSEFEATLDVDPNSVPDIHAFQRLCVARRSQRWFEDAPIPDGVLEAAANAALQAPSACNRQPFSFHAALDRDLIKKIAALPFGTAGFGDDLPCLMVVVGDLSMFAEPRDRHLIYIDASLATMQFLLALTAQRLGGVPINWPDVPENHQAVRDLLNLAPHQVPIMLVGIGVPKPTAKIAYSAKRTADEALHVWR